MRKLICVLGVLLVALVGCDRTTSEKTQGEVEQLKTEAAETLEKATSVEAPAKPKDHPAH